MGKKKTRLEAVSEVESPQAPPVQRLLNRGRFLDIYNRRPGHQRRAALLELFRSAPEDPLPVNNKWQGKSDDPDLAQLLKKGVLKRIRGNGGRRHHMNKSGSKRQTYLVLA